LSSAFVQRSAPNDASGLSQCADSETSAILVLGTGMASGALSTRVLCLDCSGRAYFQRSGTVGRPSGADSAGASRGRVVYSTATKHIWAGRPLRWARFMRNSD